jgi:dephospho-CoA kinase
MAENGKPVIGLLGLPGAGKSTVAAEMADRGAAVIDADALARQAMSEPAVREAVLQRLGEAVLTDGGEVDRAAVGRAVFGDEPALRWLEGLIHPRVRARRRELRENYAGDPDVLAIVEDSPLLLESGLDQACDVLVLVEAPREERLRRLAESRGWREDELARREKNQWPLDKKRKRADHVISNGAGEAGRTTEASRVFSQILQERDKQ